MTMDALSYPELVRLLQEETAVRKRNGVPTIIKKIPDCSVERGELDPRVYANLEDQLGAGGFPVIPDLDQMDIQDIPIAQLRAQMGCRNEDVTTSSIQTIYRQIPGKHGSIPIRVYLPEHGSTSMPGILFFHGGGFMGGTVDVIENACKMLSERAGAVVIAVSYRLAPEYPYPSGLTDCYDAVKWVYENGAEIHVNPDQLVVTGDSAGGNYSAVCAMMDRDWGTGMIKYKALIYPSVNLCEADTDDHKWNINEYEIRTGSHKELILASIYGLKDSLPLVRKLYLQHTADPADPYVSPLHALDLSGMPETLIITAEFDKFRLEGEAYARKLIRAGVRTEVIQYNGMDHGFIDKAGIYPQVEDCMNEIAQRVTRFFSD